MKKPVATVICIVVLNACVDPLCGATEQAGRLSVRSFFQEESFVRRCEHTFSIDLFSVDAVPVQDNLRSILQSTSFETFDVGDHDIASGTYVQCPNLEGNQLGGVCTAFVLEVGDGVVSSLQIVAPDSVTFYSTKDIFKYEQVEPFAADG